MAEQPEGWTTNDSFVVQALACPPAARRMPLRDIDRISPPFILGPCSAWAKTKKDIAANLSI